MIALIVDDNQELRKTLRFLLDGICTVSEAADGESAVRAVRENPIRLVLLDMKMPGMSGIETLREIKKIQPHLRVVMLTGEQEIAAAQEALSLGADAYITKPFDPEVLKAEVRRGLGLPDSAPKADIPPWRIAR